jgi:cytochrome bd-type quinol oxidase subunit 1
MKGGLDMTSPWLCWLYQYAVGGVLFFGALILALRASALRLDEARNRRLLAVLLGGYFVLAAIHAGWIAAVLR